MHLTVHVIRLPNRRGLLYFRERIKYTTVSSNSTSLAAMFLHQLEGLRIIIIMDVSEKAIFFQMIKYIHVLSCCHTNSFFLAQIKSVCCSTGPRILS